MVVNGYLKSIGLGSNMNNEQLFLRDSIFDEINRITEHNPGELGNWSLRNKIAKFSLLHEDFYTTQKTKNHFLSKGLDISKRNTPDRTRNGFTFEHPIMCKYIADYLLEKKPGLKKLEDILMETNYVVILTQEENKLFSKFKLSRNMPTGWKIGDDPFAKYKVAGIKVLKKKIRMHGKLISR